MKRSLPALAAFALLLSGCIQPHYRRPEVPTPAFRGQSPGDTGADGSLGELRWQDLIRDERLNELIGEALENNHDVKIAMARVLEARAQVGEARSRQFPGADAQVSYNNVGMSRDGSMMLPDGLPAQSTYTKLLSAGSWELDLWGRLRNATAAARAQLLATEEARHLVRTALIGELAGAYFLLRDLDLEREIAVQSLASRQQSLELVRLRVENGYSSEIDLRQAEQLVKYALTARTDLERQIEQAENRISFLAGRGPGPIPRGRSLTEQELAFQPRPGLPSALLQRRPDIRKAEQELIAGYALVAVAKAAYFPAISLTTTAGFESSELVNILKTASRTWLLEPGVSVPVFNAGRLRAGLRGAVARRQQALLNYQRTVLGAFREVADALIGYRKAVELRKEQESLVASLRDTVELADLRYRGGVSSYLEYLDSERGFLDGGLRLAQVRREELISLIALYLALGGGWQ